MPENRTDRSSLAFAATTVDVEESLERWSEYKLSDGTTLRLRPVVMEVLRQEGQYDQEGDPQYTVKTTLVIVAKSPETLRKKVTS